MSFQVPPPFVRFEVERALGGFPIWQLLERAAMWAFSAAPESVRVTSFYRDPAHNRRVGGHPLSQHVIGLAFDLGAEADPEVIRRLVLAGLRIVDERDGSAPHYHVQVGPPGTVAALGLESLARIA